MKNKLNVLIVFFLPVILISCGGESSQSSDNPEVPELKKDVEKGVVVSAQHSTLALKASSFVFEKETKTIQEVTISNILCAEANPVCSALMRLTNNKDVIFKSNSESIDYKSSNEFDKQVKGLLYFADSKMKATLLYHVRPSAKGIYFLGQIVVPAGSFEKIDTEVTIYVKGRSN